MLVMLAYYFGHDAYLCCVNILAMLLLHAGYASWLYNLTMLPGLIC
jgi:hypothetical protein